MENQTINPLLCDLETGQCQIPDSSTLDVANKPNKALKIIYYTDPICSTCWGIEPQLRKLKLEYGNDLDIEYRMGGLLPDWSYNSGGISKPSDVAHHWDEVSQYYDMPIDGDIWLEDPLPSSYPPSIAFKAAQLQDEVKAIEFLRKMREMVFLQKKNITKWANVAEAAQAVGLDSAQLRIDYDGKARTHFKDDLELGRQLAVRGFPTLFFRDDLGRQEVVYGFKPYDLFEKAVQDLHPLVVKEAFDTQWQSLFSVYHSLTAREFAELSGMSRQESESYLQKLAAEGELSQLDTKNGSLWSNKN
ncbi:protease adaptor protein SpxH [Spirosoma flavus]